MNKLKKIIHVGIAFMLLQSGAVTAGIITYNLSDKGPGALNPPDYGLRLDDLFEDQPGGTSTTESNWTWSFNANGASVQMDIDTGNNEVRIHGTVYGGEDPDTDNGGGGATDWVPATKAFWNLDFTYDTNLTISDFTDGYWNVPMGSIEANYGWLELIGVNADGTGGSIDLDGDSSDDRGKYIGISDYKGGDFIANGGPSPSGPFVSAWLQSTDGFIGSNNDLANETYVRPNGGSCCMDFGFRATKVPEPGTMLLLGIGLAGLGIRRRSQK